MDPKDGAKGGAALRRSIQLPTAIRPPQTISRARTVKPTVVDSSRCPQKNE